MAKLRARGRQEIVRMVRERETPDDRLTTSEKEQAALMSDGNVLKRRTIRWREASYGSATHDYGWKVAGKIKAGLTPEDFVRIYQERDYVLESFSASHLVRRGDFVENVSGEPVRTEARAVAEKRTRQSRAQPGSSAARAASREGLETLSGFPSKRRAARPAQGRAAQGREELRRRGSSSVPGEERGEGPGLYVTNAYLGGGLGVAHRAAAHGPFSDMELAELAAWNRLKFLRDMSFQYLQPVQIVESPSMDAAEQGVGHVWWVDGSRRGPPADPRQTQFQLFG